MILSKLLIKFILVDESKHSNFKAKMPTKFMVKHVRLILWSAVPPTGTNKRLIHSEHKHHS